jgi:translocator protein
VSVTHLADSRIRGPHRWFVLGGLLLATYGVAALGSLATTSGVDGWYAAADKPFFTPPNWLFGPVWTALYGLVAVAAWLVWVHRDRNRNETSRGLRWWWVQLALNLAWTPVFFALQLLWPALVVILALDVAVAVTAVTFRRVDRLAATLLLPYLGWIAFATALNAGVAALN